MKKIILLSLLVIYCFSFGQKVKFSGEKVLIDNKEVMKFKSKNLNTQNTFYSLDNKRLFSIDMIQNKVDHYVKIVFLETGEIVTTSNTSLTFRKDIIINLIEEGVLDINNGTIVKENIKNYYTRYNKVYKEPETTIIVNEESNSNSRGKFNLKFGK